MNVSISVQAQRALDMLDGMAERARRTEPASAQILGDVQRMIGRQFTSSGAYRGPAWALYKERVKSRRTVRIAGPGGVTTGELVENDAIPPRVRQKLASKDPRVRRNARKLLQATGEMRKGLTGKESPSKSDADSISIIASVPYARYHQRGTSKLPARPMIRLDERDVKRHARILIAHITQAQDSVSRRTRGESA